MSTYFPAGVFPSLAQTWPRGKNVDREVGIAQLKKTKYMNAKIVEIPRTCMVEVID